jgi:hypothetical protein
MINIVPPKVMPYAPATQPIAFVDVMVQRDELTNRLNVVFFCLDGKKNRISIDQNGVPKSQVSPDQLATFVSQPSKTGDTFDQDISRRALPIVQANLGLAGTVS